MAGVAITRVTLEKMNNAIIPLPPLEEQEKIVEKIKHLFSLCNLLEDKLIKSIESQTQLLNSVMSHIQI